MKETILEVISRGKEQGVKLYLCGITHFSLRYHLYVPLEGIVRAVEPGLILLEGRTPDSIYRNGKATGSLVRELKKPSEHYLFTPNLGEIKRIVDESGILVKGMDLPSRVIDALGKRFMVRSTRIISAHESLEKRSEDLIHGTPDELSSEEFRRIEELRDALYDVESEFQDFSKDAYDVNDASRNYDILMAVLNKFSDLHRFFPKVMKDLRKFYKDLAGYMKERDKGMARNIKNDYDGNIRILGILGSAHLRYSSLSDLIKAEGIPFVKFINHIQPSE